MTPRQTLLRAYEVINLLAHGTAMAAMLPTSMRLATLARACGRARFMDRRLRRMLFDLMYPPLLPDHDQVVRITHMALDELMGARRVARVVARALALREPEHRALIERALTTEVARVG